MLCLLFLNGYTWYFEKRLVTAERRDSRECNVSINSKCLTSPEVALRLGQKFHGVRTGIVYFHIILNGASCIQENSSKCNATATENVHKENNHSVVESK